MGRADSRYISGERALQTIGGFAADRQPTVISFGDLLPALRAEPAHALQLSSGWLTRPLHFTCLQCVHSPFHSTHCCTIPVR